MGTRHDTHLPRVIAVNDHSQNEGCHGPVLSLENRSHLLVCTFFMVETHHSQALELSFQNLYDYAWCVIKVMRASFIVF